MEKGKQKGKRLYVSEEVWEKLMKLKIETRAKNIDQVLRKLLEERA